MKHRGKMEAEISLAEWKRSPELSPHMSRNLADISRLLQLRRGFSFEEAKRNGVFFLVCVENLS